jgi:hypothetical protein
MALVPPIFNRIRSSNAIWAILAALVSFLLASLFNLYAGIGAGLAGGLLWWVLIERPTKPTLLRGALSGFLTALLAHPSMWIIGAFLGDPVFAAFIFSDVSGSVTSLSELTEVTTAVAVFTFLGLLIGFLTLPLGIAAGLGLVVLRRRFQSKSDKPTTESEAHRQ